MTTTPVPYISAEAHEVTYLNVGYTVRSWLLTIDHKRIALLYMLSVTLSSLSAGFSPR